MRPSPRLIALVLALTALTVLFVLRTPDPQEGFLLIWGLATALALADLFLSPAKRNLQVDFNAPRNAYCGVASQLPVHIATSSVRLPQGLDARLDADSELGANLIGIDADQDNRQAVAHFSLQNGRRGQFQLRSLSLMWKSRLGLFDIIGEWPINIEVKVMPDIGPIHSGQIQTQMLPLLEGQKVMALRGEGSDFHQLREYQPGMDMRTIDWKRSARGRSLVARETRAERNHQIIFCLDSGHLMTEDIAGLPKLDRAINAALALAWAAGLGGDQIGLYSFDSRPRLFLPPAAGQVAFSAMQARCAALKYDSSETNHTLGITHLHTRLKRRSLVVIFSDFVDTTTAELLVENIGVISRHHLILYIALRDPALMELAHPDAIDMQAMARAVSANQILTERTQVLESLSRMGVLCLETEPEKLVSNLISRYIDIKARELI